MYCLCQRVIKECPGKSGESLQCLVEQLKQAVKQHVSTWITGQGGWVSYDKHTLRPPPPPQDQGGWGESR